MNLKKSLLSALLISTIGIVAWELYWRSQDYIPTIDDNKALWAVQRDRVADLTPDNIILMGSSRTLFDIQLDNWENQTGIRPIQLANVGSSPLPVFHDIVENTAYAGTVIVGVTPGLFFSTTFPKAEPWSWPQSKVDYYQDRTYAQRINHQLSLPLQQNLALMSAGEQELDDNIDLKALLKRIKIGDRIPQGMPPFYEFGEITSLDRNLEMIERTLTDTAFANTIINVWKYFGKGAPPPDKEATMAFFLKDAEKFKARGGNLILIRCPSSGGLRAGENQVLPRKYFWDNLVEQTNVQAYHFEDYEQLKHLKCPEWSHLSAEDARYFTTELAKIMIADKAITNTKNN
ncbi:hypothetical protein [Sediminicola arcticus]|jgi:hypothetical protein|uniref:SGNH/GDSL hydrolase family protein n=1 Tax=Sediminicola arcticus TaxID=1574308 RepID=A0ABV2SWQ2_9FLAO